MEKKTEYLKILFKTLFSIEKNIKNLNDNRDSKDYEKCDACRQFKDVKIELEEQQNFKLVIENLIEEYLKLSE